MSGTFGRAGPRNRAGSSRLRSSAPSWVLRKGGQAAILDVDFANDQAWLSPSEVTIASLLSCTRANSKYVKSAAGVLVQKTANVLPYSTAGLVVEGACTNLFAAPEDIAGASWSSLRITQTQNQAADPSGGTASDKLAASASNAFGSFTQQNFTISSGAVHTVSYYALRGDNDWCAIFASDNVSVGVRVYFNLATGAVGSTQAIGAGWTAAPFIEAMGGGIYRIGARITPTGTALYAGLHPVVDADGSPSATLNKFNYFWGAQCRAGSFEGSYVSGSRAADNVSFSGLSWLNSSQGTFHVIGSSPETSVYALSGVSGVSLVRSGTASQAVANNGTTDLTATAGSGGWSASSAAALAYDGTGRSLRMNAGTVATDANTVGTLSSVYVGSNAGAASFWGGPIERLAYWDQRIADANL